MSDYQMLLVVEWIIALEVWVICLIPEGSKLAIWLQTMFDAVSRPIRWLLARF